jgi:hypothetical protein
MQHSKPSRAKAKQNQKTPHVFIKRSKTITQHKQKQQKLVKNQLKTQQALDKINQNLYSQLTRGINTFNMNNIPTLELDDFFKDENDKNATEMPKFTPKTISTAFNFNEVKNTVALITKPCCSLCVLPFNEITKAYFKYPNTFNYVEIDLTDDANIEEYRGRYKFSIPVVQINGKTFSKGNFEAFVNQFDAEIQKLAAHKGEKQQLDGSQV